MSAEIIGPIPDFYRPWVEKFAAALPDDVAVVWEAWDHGSKWGPAIWNRRTDEGEKRYGASLPKFPDPDELAVGMLAGLRRLEKMPK